MVVEMTGFEPATRRFAKFSVLNLGPLMSQNLHRHQQNADRFYSLTGTWLGPRLHLFTSAGQACS